MPTMETRSVKSRRSVVAHGPLFGNFELPSCVFGHILGYLDLASLVRASGCNTAIRKQVYDDEHEHEELWRIIDFTTVPKTMAEKITDRQVKALLQNCHARDRCLVLNVENCNQVEGAGLEPFRGSRCLRVARLRGVHGDFKNDFPFCCKVSWFF